MEYLSFSDAKKSNRDHSIISHYRLSSKTKKAENGFFFVSDK